MEGVGAAINNSTMLLVLSPLWLMEFTCKHLSFASFTIKSYEIENYLCFELNLKLEMAALLKSLCLVIVLVILGFAEINRVDGAGECGKSTTPDREAFKLAPCASAAQDENAPVSSQCCAQVKKIGQNPACLCAVMLSNTAKSSGVKAEIAVTIPKRCNLADRPVGYKCGGSFACSPFFNSFTFSSHFSYSNPNLSYSFFNNNHLNWLVSCSLHIALKSNISHGAL